MRKNKIIEEIFSYINDFRPEFLMRFTFGEGTTGLEREIYYAGWVVVESLLKRGYF